MQTFRNSPRSLGAKGVICTVGLLFAGALSGHAAVIWNTPVNITSNAAADVKTNGTHVAALALGQGAAVTINGVTFDQTTQGTPFDNPYPFTLFKSGETSATSTIIVNAGGSDSSSAYVADASYNSLLHQRAFIFTSPPFTAPINLQNLTNGLIYQVQIWSANAPALNPLISSPGGSSVTLNSGVGQYVVGTFTATGTSQALSYYGGDLGNTQFGIINAISLRVIPEPNSVLLLGIGSMLVLAPRRRFKSASSNAS